jgi:hypothetical protein
MARRFFVQRIREIFGPLRDVTPNSFGRHGFCATLSGVGGGTAAGDGRGASAEVAGFINAASMEDAGATGNFFFARGGLRPCFTSSSSCDFLRRMW